MKPINLSIATESDIVSVAENWYNRLSRLKAWIIDNPAHPRNQKACGLAAQMVLRILSVAEVHRKVKALKDSKYLSRYASGGVMPTVKEGTHEAIETRIGKRVMIYDAAKNIMQNPQLN